MDRSGGNGLFRAQIAEICLSSPRVSKLIGRGDGQAWLLKKEPRLVRNPLAERAPLRGHRRLPRPIREQNEQRALDVAISSVQQPYRLMFTVLHETGRRVGEVPELRWGDVTLDSGREALRVCEPKNGQKRAVVLGPTATPRTLRGLRAARRGAGRTPAD